MKLLIRNGHVIDPANKIDRVLDLCIENGTILKIGENLRCGEEADILDASGKIVAPGLVDMHCHLREPGQEYKEDIESGTKSAAMGGFTTIACMPNTQPAADNASVIAYIKERSESVGSVRVYPIGAVTKGLRGEELAPMGELKAAGAVAVSDDGQPVTNDSLMRRALEYAAGFRLPVISHCEVKALSEGSMNEGYVSTMLGLRGINRAAEEIMVSRDILLAKNLHLPVHIAHVSTEGSVELVRRAKAEGVKVTCETCPHYFSLTEEAVVGYDTNAKMNPPLRAASDVQAVIRGLKDRTIDAIATDHAPHHIDEKNCEFEKALNGIVGFETALSLGLTYLVRTGELTLSELIEKMSFAPSGILGLDRGTLTEGKSADIVLFDPEEKRTVDTGAFLSKSKNSPYNGFTLYGKVYGTIVGGKIVVENGRLKEKEMRYAD